MLTLAFAVFIWPAILIAAIVGWVKGKDQDNYSQQTYTKTTRTNNKYTVQYETPEQERRRTEYWGYDDDKWGKL